MTLQEAHIAYKQIYYVFLEAGLIDVSNDNIEDTDHFNELNKRLNDNTVNIIKNTAFLDVPAESIFYFVIEQTKYSITCCIYAYTNYGCNWKSIGSLDILYVYLNEIIPRQYYYIWHPKTFDEIFKVCTKKIKKELIQKGAVFSV